MDVKALESNAEGPRREPSLGQGRQATGCYYRPIDADFALTHRRPAGGRSAEERPGCSGATTAQVGHSCSKIFEKRARSAAKGTMMIEWRSAEDALKGKRSTIEARPGLILLHKGVGDRIQRLVPVAAACHRHWSEHENRANKSLHNAAALIRRISALGFVGSLRRLEAPAFVLRRAAHVRSTAPSRSLFSHEGRLFREIPRRVQR